MSKGNRTTGPRKGRPPLAKGEARESLSCRVKPETLRWLTKAGGKSGLGFAVDVACSHLRASQERLNVALRPPSS